MLSSSLSTLKDSRHFAPACQVGFAAARPVGFAALGTKLGIPLNTESSLTRGSFSVIEMPNRTKDCYRRHCRMEFVMLVLFPKLRAPALAEGLALKLGNLLNTESSLTRG